MKSYLWNVFIYKMSYQWNVISMKCPIYYIMICDMSFYEIFFYEMSRPLPSYWSDNKKTTKVLNFQLLASKCAFVIHVLKIKTRCATRSQIPFTIFTLIWHTLSDFMNSAKNLNWCKKIEFKEQTKIKVFRKILLIRILKSKELSLYNKLNFLITLSL